MPLIIWVRVDSFAPPRSLTLRAAWRQSISRLAPGARLRVAEGLALRVKDVDVGGGKVEVRSGKGDKDRVVSLPKSLLPWLTEHLARLRQVYAADRAAGAAGWCCRGRWR